MSVVNPDSLPFDEQAFLWDFMGLFPNLKSAEEIKKLSQTTQTRLVAAIKMGQMADIALRINYPHFIPINTGDASEALLLLNKLVGTGANAFKDLSTGQISALVPKIELWKIVPGPSPKAAIRSYKFPFKQHTTVHGRKGFDNLGVPGILKSNQGRGVDGGIVSVAMTDTGDNPATTGLVFSGEIKFHLASIESLWIDRKVDGHKLQYADLLDARGVTGKSCNESAASIASNPTNIQPGEPKIRLVVGYSIPSDPKGVLGFTPALLDTIRAQQRSYIISPLDQEMQFAPNGTVNLTLSFIARIEGAAVGPRADLLAIDPNHPQIKFLHEKKQYLETQQRNAIASREATRAAAAENTDNLAKPPSEGGAHGESFTDDQEAALEYFKTKLSTLKQDINSYRLEYNAIDGEIRSVAYGRILGLIRKTLSDKDEDRIFHVDLPGSVIREYKKITASSIEALSKSEQANQAEKEQIRTSHARATATTRAELYKKIYSEGIFSTTPSQFQMMDSDIQEKRKSKALQPGHYRLSFFYLGDLFNALMRVLYERPIRPSKQGKGAKSTENLAYLKNDIRLMVGEIAYYDPRRKIRVVTNLADIPIPLHYFNAWFFTKVIKQQRNHYSLRAFLGDFCTSFLNNVFAPKHMGPSWAIGGTKQARIQPIWQPTGGALDELWKKPGKGKRTWIQNILDNPGKAGDNVDEYILLHVNGNLRRQKEGLDPNGPALADNIPHYVVGRESGPVLDIKFNRTKIPGKRESMLADAVNHMRGNLMFADRYDADIKILGNPTLKPGMLVFIDTKAMGLGVEASSCEDPSWRADLGIGGYYRVVGVNHLIDSGQFITNLTTISEVSTRQLGKRLAARSRG